MKATKILAGMSAAALAASMLTMVSASADDTVVFEVTYADGATKGASNTYEVVTNDIGVTEDAALSYSYWQIQLNNMDLSSVENPYLLITADGGAGDTYQIYSSDWEYAVTDGTDAVGTTSEVAEYDLSGFVAAGYTSMYIMSNGAEATFYDIQIVDRSESTGTEGDSSATEDDSSAAEVASDTVIYDTETDLGTGWGAWVTVDASSFTDATVGDTVTINFTENSDDTYWQLKIMDGNWDVLDLDGVDETYGTVSFADSDTSYTFTLTDDLLSALQSSGMVIGGYNTTINSVVLTTTAGDSEGTDDGEATEPTVTTTVSDESLLDTLDTENAAVLASNYIFNTEGNDIFLLSGSQDYFTVEGPYTEDFDTLAEYTAFTMVLSYDADTIADAINNGTWFGGCIVLNSASTDWDQTLTWTIILDENGDPQFVLYTSDETDSEGNVTYILDDERYEGYAFVDNGDGTASLTVLYTDSIFTVTGAEDEYAQIWFCDWSGDKSVIGATGLELVSLASTDEPGTTTSSEEDESSEDGDESEDESSEEDEESEDESSEETDESEADESDADEDEDSSTTSTAASTSSTASTTSSSDSNPATGAAALGGLGILLAGAAIVVSKRK